MNKANLKVLIWISSLLAAIGIGVSIYAYSVEESSMGNLAGAILAIVGLIGTIATLFTLSKEKPTIQLDFNIATKLADEMLKAEIALRDKTIEALKANDLKTSHVSKESIPINKYDIGQMKILSIIGLIALPLGTGLLGALYGIIFSVVGLKKKIRNTEMLSSIGLTFFILFSLLLITALISKEFVTILILWLFSFFFGIIYCIIWIKMLNAIAKEQGYNLKEFQKQYFEKYKKTLIIIFISIIVVFCILFGVGIFVGYHSGVHDKEEIKVVEPSGIDNSNVLLKENENWDKRAVLHNHI